MASNDITFDSLALVRDRRVLSGTLTVVGLERLAEVLQETNGALNYRVEGVMDSRQRPLLRLWVTGTVRLQCQRCLDGLAHVVNIDTAVRLVAAQALDQEYDDNPDEPDCVAASKTFDLAALIEDEVLLALPAYPRHEAGQCAAVASDLDREAKIKAFSVLQALKQK